MAMGNNPFQSKRQQKARDPKKAEEMSSWLNGKQVKRGASEGNPITLGRIAKAYAPVLLAMRISIEARLRVQVVTSSPVSQCDIAFLGYDNTKRCALSRDYCEKFGIIITKANPAFTKLSDDEILKRNRCFADIARNGLDADTTLKDLLNSDALPSIDEMMKKLHRRKAPPTPATTGAPTMTPTAAPAPKKE